MKLTFASRIFAGYFLVVAIAAWFLINSLLDEIKPVVRQAVEHTLVDTSNLLAEIFAEQVHLGKIDQSTVDAVTRTKLRLLNAEIWSHPKETVSFNLYITDQDGIVMYDSESLYQGHDFSKWRDVTLTLRGDYGARSTRDNEDNPLSTVMHVAAPIIWEGEIIGAITLYTPNLSLQPFLDISRGQTLRKGLSLLLVALLVGAFLSYWLSHSITRLVRYANKVKDGERVEAPRLGGSELRHLVDALESMRQKLEGKDYVEQYVQQLAHELKSPVAAIKGASELLAESPPIEVQQKFFNNIQQQSNRMQFTIDKMLHLAALENTQLLKVNKPIDLSAVCFESIDSKRSKADAKHIQLSMVTTDQANLVTGDANLLQLSIDNLIDNAIDFADSHTAITVSILNQPSHSMVSIENLGKPIPDYAIDRIFDRFYSLSRPDGQAKSTGLGLSFVQEVALLHQGTIVVNNTEHGVLAQLTLPNFTENT